VAAIRFSPDGQTLVTRSNDRSVGLWDAATAAPRGPRLEHEGLTSAVAISPNGRLLATGSVDCTVRIWDARAGRVSPRATLAQIEAVTALAFSPNGRMLGIGLGNGAAAIYDLDLLKPLGPPMVQQSVIEGVAFTADGRRLVTTGRDGTTRSWPIPAPCGDDLDRIAMRLQVRTAMRGVANGQAVEPLEAPAWEASRRRLIDLEGSADSAYESLVSDQEYHDARARDAEQDGNIFAAIWHLDRLLAFADRGTADLETSPRWLLHARRARAQATAGRFEPADADYAEAERLASRTLVLDWYRHCVVDCEDIRNWTAAVWYLDRLIAAQPGDWRAYERRAQAYGQLGREDARRSDLARAIELGADPRLLDQNTPK
jgi:tetratricopeptide (TPR) repeat protein